MAAKKYTLISLWAFLIIFSFGLTPPGTVRSQAVDAAPNQPFASYWFPNALLSWSPASDSDAAFNRGNTPLATRFVNPALNVNPHARVNEARVAALAAFEVTSNNPSQGELKMNYYATNYWQYMDVLVFWGGSSAEGLILAPNPTVIDAAHRNGVPVLGTIFLPPTAFGGNIQWVRDLVQKSGTAFPVADKLIEVAQYYGFEGWFVNQETAGGDAALAAQVRDFMKYLKARSSLRIMWYDSMVESGGIAWQGALNSSNDMFFQDGSRVSDDMFLDFRWSSGSLSSSRSFAQNLGRNPYELYAGVDTEANGYNTGVNWAGIFPEGQAHVVSLGFYRPEWTFKSATNPADFYTRDNRFWVGANRDPSNTATTSAWKGVAHYVPAKSPINRLPFVTNFNTGQGSRYAINGQVLRTRDWHNLSVQDVLPTWRWIVESTGTKLFPDLVWDDAYYGGTSLKVSGTLNAPNHLKLFATQLPIAADTNLRIAYKTGIAGAPTHLKVGLAFEDSPTNFQYLDVGSTTGAGWNTTTFGLGSFASRTLAALSLRFESSSPVNNYAIYVGQVALYNGAVDIPSAPSGLTVTQKAEINANQATLRLQWTHAPGILYYYNVYRRNPDNSLTYLGSTPNNAYFVAEVNRVGSENSTVVEVEAVGPEFGHSSRATTSFSWGTTLPTATPTRTPVGPTVTATPSRTPTSTPLPGTNLALNKPATADSACNANEGPAKAVNGSVSGGSTDKWCSLGGSKWLQVDLGVPSNVNQFVVKHAGAGGESAAWNTSAFNTQVSLDGSTWNTVVDVSGNTANVTTHTIGVTSARYVRLNIITPTGNGDPAARIYEFEVYGASGATSTPTATLSATGSSTATPSRTRTATSIGPTNTPTRTNTPATGTNLALNKPATGSTACNANEGPAKAVNGSVSGGNSDKWCSLAATKFLQVDLGATFNVNQFVVKHAGAGGESVNFNTRAFTLQVSTNGTTWTTVVTVSANTANVTTHPIPATSARYVRLNLTTPTQTTDNAARIYELEVYGSN